ncbi:hypothetical protein [Hamadaea tsunoensis]|uniref:hypothetical protein n=1 Tax=Hamadaea tsunoensis TaxID=53368 RepID=UPI000413F183|nr:hypothetical protein [Hamadaea tsunoensis]
MTPDPAEPPLITAIVHTGDAYAAADILGSDLAVAGRSLEELAAEVERLTGSDHPDAAFRWERDRTNPAL